MNISVTPGFRETCSLAEGNVDIEMMALEETTVVELEAESDQLEAGSAPNPHDTNEHVGQLPREITTAQLHEVYDLEEVVAIRKGFALQPAREESTIHDRAEQPEAWDPADILRALQYILGGKVYR